MDPLAVEESRLRQPLRGQTAVVVGAGRGIGRAIAMTFAGQGASVACAARTEDEIRRTADVITARGGSAMAVWTDVRSPEAMERLMATTVDAYGRIDIVVLGAGIPYPLERLETIDIEGWRDLVDTHLTGVLLGIQTAIPPLRRNGGGKIIVLGAASARRAPVGMAAIAAPKAGVTTLVRIAARELRSDNIAVNEIQPGPTATPSHGIDEPDAETFGSRRVLLEEGLEDDISMAGEWFKSPQTVADLALFIAKLPNHGASGQIFSFNCAV